MLLGRNSCEDGGVGNSNGGAGRGGRVYYVIGGARGGTGQRSGRE